MSNKTKINPYYVETTQREEKRKVIHRCDHTHNQSIVNENEKNMNICFLFIFDFCPFLSLSSMSRETKEKKR